MNRHAALWLIASAVLAHSIVSGVLQFPTDWDCLMYHMPMIDEWIQARSLYAPDSSYWWSPGASELLGLLLAAPFSGDFYVPLANVPVVIFWAASAASIARSLGMPTAWANLAALAVPAVATTIRQANQASNDLGVAAFFLAAVACWLKSLDDGRTRHVLAGGLCLGVLAGIKYPALGYALVVLLVWTLGLVAQPMRAGGVRAGLALWAIAALTGGGWYLRNFLVAGSPLYPMGLSGALPALSYPPPGLASTSFWGNTDPLRWTLVLPTVRWLAGPAHVAAVVLVPAQIAALAGLAVVHWRSGRPSAEGARLAGLALLLLGSALVLLVTPFAVEDQTGTLNHLRWGDTPIRFGLCFVSVAALGALWMTWQVVGRLKPDSAQTISPHFSQRGQSAAERRRRPAPRSER